MSGRTQCQSRNLRSAELGWWVMCASDQPPMGQNCCGDLLGSPTDQSSYHLYHHLTAGTSWEKRLWWINQINFQEHSEHDCYLGAKQILKNRDTDSSCAFNVQNTSFTFWWISETSSYFITIQYDWNLKNRDFWSYPIVPMALLNGLCEERREASGVRVLVASSAAMSSELRLRLESDIPQADPCLSTDKGVALTMAFRYRSCSTEELESECDTPKKEIKKPVSIVWKNSLKVT